MSAANIFTLGRLALVAPMGYAIHAKMYPLSLLFFIFAAASDFIDGFIARRFNQKTRLGAYLDPMTDKILIFVGNFLLVAQDAVPLWFFILVTAKDLFLAGGYFVFRIKVIINTPDPNIWGKMAVFIQAIIVGLGIVHKGFFELRSLISLACILCSFFTVVSSLLYIRVYISEMKGGRIKDAG